ncbi:TIGR04222 domain-containing membrane protein [Actinokineospora spheciospongiae]|uniref:TIGR04222 domain-containing membrane protein n=1 Tax=Actinokineospora spheciospongiae TaxID=909613 RepID=UPI000D71BD7A|nr:TIGR04222 domain-containing membrane protein [Actinokineospora spheciospongiae]PWW59543.1 uncharacterized protein (TIGR04222 family) [Actinokineospora spheciospongiae]
MGGLGWAWAGAFALVVAVPLLLHAHDRSRAAQHGDRIAAGDEWSAFSVGLLTGGPRRAVDTVIVGLLERGVLRARGGVISRAGRGGTLSGMERAVVDSVGRGVRLSSLRLAAVLVEKRPFLVVYRTFQERGLVVGGGWRRHWAILQWAVLLCGTSVAVLYLVDRRALDGTFAAVGVAGLFAVPVVLLAARRGRLGSDPRTALGHAVSRRLRERVVHTRADAVAGGGLAGIGDRLVRMSIQDVEPDGVWGPSAKGSARDLTELNWLADELIHNTA